MVRVARRTNDSVSADPAAITLPSHGGRLAGIDGLRALAAFSILVYHVWLISSPAERVGLGPFNQAVYDLAHGVTLFFALSGFLLYRPFAAALVRGRPRPSVATYFRNRVLRILPAYWVILVLVTLVLRSVLVRDSSGMRTGSGLEAKTFLANAFFVQNYVPSMLGTGIGPAWSLAVEVVFYLTLPLLALLAWRLAGDQSSIAVRRMAALAPAAVLLVLGLSGRLVAAVVVPPVGPNAGWEADWHSVIVRSFWCQADLFAFGMALAVLFVDWEDGRLRLPRRWRVFATIAALIGYAVTARGTVPGDQLSHSPYNTLMALCCSLVLAAVVLSPRRGDRPSPMARLLDHPVLVSGGVISYSVFLWHEPLVRWFRDQGITRAGPGGLLLNLALVSLATLLLSVLSYRLVEAPALRLRERRRAV